MRYPCLSSRSQEAVTAGLHAVAMICHQRGLQFTENRVMVMETLLQAEHPMRAYELLEVLASRLERTISPPTVYRALEFLLQHGFISRIETTNAYTPITQPDHDQSCFFLICETCGSLAEIENAQLEAMFEQDAAVLGFRIGKRVIELQGTCADCQTAEATVGLNLESIE